MKSRIDQPIKRKFIGRQYELAELERFTKKTVASFIVVRGRRRIGKSRLIREFGLRFDTFYTFSGLPPEANVTMQDQLEVFSRQIAEQCKTPYAPYDNWSNALSAVAYHVKKGKVLLLFDEISWMGSEDPAFLGKIKNFWDLQLSENPQLIFIICGSASSWIEKNILGSTGFVGRISFRLTLEELSLAECNDFWPKHISAYEKFKLLSITGGIPRYLEEIDFKVSAEENIRNLCFKKDGFLVQEFDNIFSDLFLRDSVFYREIVRVLASGSKEFSEICTALNLEPSGRMSEYLQELELTGFVRRDYTWNIETGHDLAKISSYRLSDNYVRFYLKYIEKYRSKIARNTFATKSLSSLPELQTIMGLQFENLVLNSRKEIHQILGIAPGDIISENPFFQRATKLQKGCQIDYMIQTKFNTLYVCEIKFSIKSVGIEVVEEVKQKIDRIKLPRGYSIRPVLIHVNGVAQEVEDGDFFAKIIDFGSLLKG